MESLLTWFVILAPLEPVGIAVAGVYIHGAAIIAAVIAAFGAFQFVIGNWQLSKADRWVWPFVGFLVVASVSLATSPYFSAAAAKGVAQLLGVSALLLFALTFAHASSRDGKLFLTLLRYNSGALGIIGLIAVAQFAINNAVGSLVVSFDFLNPFLGIPWIDSGSINGIFRASSIATEPAHMATFLVAGSGLALIRFGLLGPVSHAREVTYVMPAWAAAGIIGGIAVSLSLVGYVGAVIGVLATRWLGRRFRRRKLGKYRRRAYLPVAAGSGLIVLLVLFSAQGLLEKIQTTTLISEAPALEEEGSVRDFILTENVSALAVAINLQVTQNNFYDRPMLGAGIGAHPISYDFKAPDYAFLSPIVYGLNKDDAASLLFRLVSETGWLGTGCYILGLLLVLLGGWKTARRCIKLSELDPDYAGLGAIAVGLTASSAAMMALYLMRLGIYFSAPLWGSMAFAVAFSMLVSRVRSRAPRPAFALQPAGLGDAPAE